jgi:hypothetical protein
MARRSIEERLSQLDAQRKALQSRLSNQERAKDTRRKVLLGAFLLHHLEKAERDDPSIRVGEWVRQELPRFLSREDDRALFKDITDELPSAPTDIPEGS